MTRTIKNVLRRTAFTDASAVHHDDFIAHIRNDAEVMGYHNDRHPELLLQILHQLQNLCLNGNVQRRRRLIRDQNVRLTRKRHRDHHALPHTARKLIRILLDPLFRLVNADKRQHLDRARLRLFSFAARVQLDRLFELRADSKDWIQTRHRVLENNRTAFSAEVPHFFFCKFGNVFPLVENASFLDSSVGFQNSHDGIRRYRFAGAGFSYDAENLTGVQVKRHPVDRMDLAFAGCKRGVQILYRKYCFTHAPLPP